MANLAKDDFLGVPVYSALRPRKRSRFAFAYKGLGVDLALPLGAQRVQLASRAQ